MHVSYNGNTPFTKEDIRIGANTSLACRLLSSYFRTDNVNLLASFYSEDNIQSLTINASLEAILSDHRRRLALPSDQDILLYIAVDDVSNIISNTDDGWTAEKGRGFLKSIFDGLCVIYSNWGHCFVAAMLTGTVLGHTNEILINTNRKYENLAVPLLSLDQSVLLAQDAFNRANIDKHVLEKFDWLKFKLLLSDIGGVPRFVWSAIIATLKTKLVQVDFSVIGAVIKNDVTVRYGVSAASLFHPAIVSAAILRKPINKTNRVLLNSTDISTWIDLENRGLLYFSSSLGNEATITIPCFHLQAMISSPFPTSEMRENLCIGDWSSSWEQFVASHDALLLTLHRQNGEEYVNVANYYRGAIVGDNVQNIFLTLPAPTPDPTHNTTVGNACMRFPETRNSSLGSALDASVVYINTQGAKLDIVVPHRIHGSTDSDAILYRSIHCKHTVTGKVALDPSIHDDISKYTNKVLAPNVSQSSKFLHVYISNRNMKMKSRNSPGGAKPVKLKISTDAVFISRTELEGFFSRTFSDRILLMLESKKMTVSEKI